MDSQILRGVSSINLIYHVRHIHLPLKIQPNDLAISVRRFLTGFDPPSPMPSLNSPDDRTGSPLHMNNQY